MDDPIVQQVRDARERIAKKFNYDLHALFSDVRERQKSLGDRLVAPKEKTQNEREGDRTSNA